jgi:Protein of unknown function (DUF2950)
MDPISKRSGTGCSRNATLIRGRCAWLITAAVIGIGVASSILGAKAAAQAVQQEQFQSADQAVHELIAANRSGSFASLLRILGSGAENLIRSGDPVADRAGRERFVTAYDQAHRIEYDGPDKAILFVGSEDWPMPIPIVRSDGEWRFDTKAGGQEILDRRVGRNELNVIEVCRAYVQAQREYAQLQPSAKSVREYAQHFMSRPGMHDGLYWPVAANEKESPLGPLVAEASAAGYVAESAPHKPRPYFGYYYKILTRQGPHARGGARDYLSVGGHMTGGFALLAYPAVYGDSGIMTFIVNQNGIVFERNFGPHTAAIARTIKQYDPDPSWRAVSDQAR